MSRIHPCLAVAFLITIFIRSGFAQVGEEIATSTSLKLFLEHDIPVAKIGFRPLVIASSPSGNLIALGGISREIAIWDLSGPEPTEIFKTRVLPTVGFPPHPLGRKRPFVALHSSGFVAIRMDSEKLATGLLPTGALVRLDLDGPGSKLTQLAIGKSVSSAAWDESGQLWIGTGRGAVHRIDEKGKVTATLRPIDDVAPVSFLRTRGGFLFSARRRVHLPELTREIMRSEQPWPHAGLTIWNRQSLEKIRYLKNWDGSEDVMEFSRNEAGELLVFTRDTPQEELPWGPKKRTLAYEISDKNFGKCKIRMDLRDMRKVRSQGQEIFALGYYSRLQSLDEKATVVSPYRSHSINPLVMLGDESGRYAEYFYYEQRLRVLRVESHEGPALRRLDAVAASSEKKELVALRASRVTDEEIWQILPVPNAPGRWIVLDRSSAFFLVDTSSASEFGSEKLNAELAPSSFVKQLAFNPEGTRLFALTNPSRGPRRIAVSKWPNVKFAASRPVILGAKNVRIEAMMPLSEGRILVAARSGALVVINDESLEIIKMLVPAPDDKTSGHYNTATRSGQSILLTPKDQWMSREGEKGMRVVRDSPNLESWVIPSSQTRNHETYARSDGQFVVALKRGPRGDIAAIDARTQPQKPDYISVYNRTGFPLSSEREDEITLLDHGGDISVFRKATESWSRKVFATSLFKSIRASAHAAAFSLVGLRNGEVIDLVWRER